MRSRILRPTRLLLAGMTSVALAQLPGIDFSDLSVAGAEPRTVVYKTTPEGDLTVDVYTPDEKGGNRPALIFVHGGGWTAGSNKNHREHSRYFAARGMVVFNLSYRLIPNTGEGIDLFAQVGDIRSAVRWVRTNAAAFGIDPNRVALCGESAGGHLAACVTFIDAFGDAGEDTAIPARPDAAILLNPITDLPRISWFAGHAAQVGERPLPIEDTAIDDPWDETIHPARRLSPLFYAHHPNQPPALFVHGEADTVVPFAQSLSLHGALVAAGHDSTLLALPRTDHAFVIPGWGPPEAINRTLRAMDTFLAERGFLAGAPPLLPLDVNVLTNGELDTDLASWSASGAIHHEAAGATKQSRGYIQGNSDATLALSQTVAVASLDLPADALARQLLTARLSAWIRVSALSHYDLFELALVFRQADGSVIDRHVLAWDALTPDTWTVAETEILLPADATTLEVATGTTAAAPVELDEIALTLSTTTRSKTYAQWQALYFSEAERANEAVAGANVVTDGASNLSHLEKYALGLSRHSAHVPSVEAEAAPEGLVVRFPYDGKKTDVTYGVRFSSSLDFETSAVITADTESPLPTDAQGQALATDPEGGDLRFAQVFIAPR